MSLSTFVHAHRMGNVLSRPLGIGLALLILAGALGWLIHWTRRGSAHTPAEVWAQAGAGPAAETGLAARCANLRVALERYADRDATTLSAYTVCALAEAAIQDERGAAVGLGDARIHDPAYLPLMRYGRVYLVEKVSNPFFEALHEAVFQGGDPQLQVRARAPDGSWRAPWLTPERDRTIRQRAQEALALLCRS